MVDTNARIATWAGIGVLAATVITFIVIKSTGDDERSDDESDGDGKPEVTEN